MFGIRIGGGNLYLLVYLRAVGEERWAFWKPVTPGQYRLEGRQAAGRILLNDPTLPHPLTGRPSDPPRKTVEVSRWVDPRWTTQRPTIVDDFAKYKASQR